MLPHPKIKFCGLLRLEDIAFAYKQRAYWVGFIYVKGSPRYIEFKKSKIIINKYKNKIKFVGVFVDPSNTDIKKGIDSGIDLIQLHGSESPERCKEIKNIFKVPIIKSFPILSDLDIKKIEQYKNVSDMFLFDTKNENASGYNGGTGKSFDWNIIYKNKEWLKKQKPWILSGGLDPSNIKEAINITGAKAIDVSSGIEYNSGNKSKDLMRLFAYNAHNINSKVLK